MIAEARNEMIVSAMDLVPWQARRFPRLPRGVTTDDLESAGNEALVHAATTFDPEAGTPWRTYARTCVKNAMKGVVAHARSRRSVPLEIEAESGELLPRPDPRAADPADRAAARELVAARPRRKHIDLDDAPDPAAVATRAAALREAMFGAIRDEDAAAIVGQVVAKAKGGDLRAARLFFDLLAPARAGTTVVQQQAIVVRSDDV
jgi:RNA polymerase sigma factor (sigma-70 family)